MNIRSKLPILLSLLVLLSCLPLSAAALGAAPSQAGQKVISGGQRDFAFPVPGYSMLSSCFYDNRNHCALDFPAPQGVSVVASYAGKVIATYNGCSHNYGKSSSCCSDGFGNYVVLQHDYVLKGGAHITLYSRYNHLTKATVSVGQTVSRGQQVGTMGSTGYSTGHHLDYQILYGGWTPFRSYSIDPYINELLEMPEGLHSMNSGGCCSRYVAYVKEYYPRCLHENFNASGNCTSCGYTFDYAATGDAGVMGYYTAASDISPASKPYTAALGSAGSIKAGAEVSVSASVSNGAGECWFQLEKGGYVPKEALIFSRFMDSKFDGKLTAPSENAVLKKQSYTLSGTVSSLYPLREVRGYLDGNLYGTWTGTGRTCSVELTGTDINNKLYFATLSPGKHTLTITATDVIDRGEVTVIQRTFYIEQPPIFHTVTLLADGGSCETETFTVQNGGTIGQLPTPTKEGYTFTGWYTESGEIATEDSVITAAVNLTAKWQPLTYTVAFGGILKTGIHGQPIDPLPIPNWDGYQFLGWYTEKEGGTEFTAETVVTGDITLYPRWEGRKYQVTLDPNGGTVTWHRKNVTLGGIYGAFPPVTREGYRFVGWSVDGKLIEKTTPVVIDEDHIVTAVWEAIETQPIATETAEKMNNGSLLWIIPSVLVTVSGISAACLLIIRKKRATADTIVEELVEEETTVEEPAEETSPEEAAEEAAEEPAEEESEEKVPTAP